MLKMKYFAEMFSHKMLATQLRVRVSSMLLLALSGQAADPALVGVMLIKIIKFIFKH